MLPSSNKFPPFAFVLSLITFGCSSPNTTTDAMDTTFDDLTVTQETSTDVPLDSPSPDIADTLIVDAPVVVDICDSMGLRRTPFQTTGTGNNLGEVAGDFTVQTLSGQFSFASQWSGCESYVFFVHFPNINDDVIRTPPDWLMTEGRRNVHYFFLSNANTTTARQNLMTELSGMLEQGFVNEGITDEQERQFWRSHFHYVTDRAIDVQGSVGAFLRDYIAFATNPASVVDLGDRGRAAPPPPTVFGIDREQTWDVGATLSPAVGAPADFIDMASYLSHFYEYRASLDHRLATDGSMVIPLINETSTLRVFRRDATLPSASVMAGFDTLEVDIEVVCNNRNPFACSEWDRIADVQLCLDGQTCNDRRELVRWITPYWRPGRQRYAIDASPLLGLLRSGGNQTFYIEFGPEWERATEWTVRTSLRLRTRGNQPLATGAQLAFQGGSFDASYNTRPAFHFTPPATASRVELVTILSGHGQAAGNNCAEWCDHRHSFSVNGTALPDITHSGDRIGSERGCAQRAADGVIPGQWGNWAQSRAYWCPGLPVNAVRTDITNLVRAGQDNELSYAGRFRTGTPAGGDIALSAYVVWYNNP